MKRRDRIKGISLLETVLVVALIGMVLALTIRYFSITDDTVRITRSIQAINRVTEASYTWLSENHQAEFSTPTTISLSALESAGLLQKSDEHDLWGGAIQVSPGEATRYVRISLLHVPKLPCQRLSHAFSGISHSITKPTCTQLLDNTFYGDF